MIDLWIIELKYFCYLPHFLPVHRLDFLWLRLPFWPIKATRFVGHDRSGAANWLYLPDTHLAEFALMQHHQLFAVYVVVCGFCFSIFLSLPQTNNWPDLIYHPRRFFPFVFGPLLPTPPFRSSTFGSLEVFFSSSARKMDNGQWQLQDLFCTFGAWFTWVFGPAFVAVKQQGFSSKCSLFSFASRISTSEQMLAGIQEIFFGHNIIVEEIIARLIKMLISETFIALAITSWHSMNTQWLHKKKYITRSWGKVQQLICKSEHREKFF